MRYKILLFSIAVFALLTIGLESAYRFHFFYIEQNQLFLFTGQYFSDMATQPGGLSDWTAEFLVQFFAIPYLGALITALLLTGAGVLTALVCRRMSPRVPLYILWILPVLGLLCVHFDMNWFYQGTVAFLVAQTALLAYVSISRRIVRLMVALITVLLLFWICGPIALLYALCVVIWEAMNKTPGWYTFLLVLLEAVAVSWLASHFALVGEAGRAFLPHFYYAGRLTPGGVIWITWVSLPVAIVCTKLCGRLKTSSLKREAIFTSIQIVLAVVVALAAVNKYMDRESYYKKQLDHYSRTGQWDEIIDISKKYTDDYWSLSLLNLALAEKGILGDDIFKYDQHGVKGLFYPWDNTFLSAALRSDIYFCIGSVSGAQEMAFEGYVAAPGYGNPRLLQRLVQTNLIYGTWPVAEKYLDILSKTLLYRDWAAAHRKFLYNDEAVEADPLLGVKRRCLPEESRFFKLLYGDLEIIARQNPASQTAIEYLGALALLSKDQRFFRTMIESYYGTGIIPLSLPHSFQEAIVIMYENTPGVWKHFGVDDAVIARFAGFKKRLEENRSKNGLANIMRGSHGDTYWFYYTFK